MKFSVSIAGSLLATVLLLISATGWHQFEQRIDAQAGVDVQLESLPMTLGDWTGKDGEGLGIRELETLQLSRYVRRLYTNANKESLLLYIGYWKKQSGEYQAAKHSPRLCLPSNGWKIVEESEKQVQTTLAQSSPFVASRLVGGYANGEYLFYYWFFTGEETYFRESKALLSIASGRLLHGRSDGGIVEISAPIRKDIPRPQALLQAEQSIENFIHELSPALKSITH